MTEVVLRKKIICNPEWYLASQEIEMLKCIRNNSEDRNTAVASFDINTVQKFLRDASFFIVCK